jgi:hypothetical protein
MKGETMKKALTLILLCMFCMPQSALSAPAYGTKTPEKSQFFFGGQTHFVNRRYLEMDFGKVLSIQPFNSKTVSSSHK